MLLAVNAFLLVLVLGREGQSVKYAEQARLEAISILEQNGVTLDPALVPKAMELPVMSVKRDLSGDADLAAALLGPVVVEDQGNSTVYQGEKGSLQFYTNGSFSVLPEPGAFPLNGAAPAQFSLDCLERMGLIGAVFLPSGEAESTGGSAVVHAWQLWEGAPIYTCEVTLTFRDGELRRIEGQRLTGTPMAEPSAAPLSVPTILLRVLNHMAETGDISQEITRVSQGYMLMDAQADPARLVPTWQVVTVTNTYWLDAMTGEVLKSE